MAVKPLTHPVGRTTRPAALTITQHRRTLASHLGHAAGPVRSRTGPIADRSAIGNLLGLCPASEGNRIAGLCAGSAVD
jgi:hypothetical protein